MSQTKHVEFDGRLIWAYDESLSVWLAAFVRQVESADDETARRLAPFAGVARSVATIPDIGIELDDLLRDATTLFVDMARRVSKELRDGGPIDLKTLKSIELLDDLPLLVRRRDDETEMDPEPVAEVGDGLVELVGGTMRPPPPGTTWGIGAPGGTTTIGMRDDTRP